MAKTTIDIVIQGKDKASGVMGKIGKAAKGLGIGIAGIATAAVGMGIASVKSFADAGDEIQKMAISTGFSTESLSELKHAAELSGSSLTALSGGFRKMARFVDDAKAGMSTATDVMDTLGMTAKDLEGLSPEETFNKLSTAVADLEDPLAQQNAAMELFGKTGTELLPMLSQGAEGLNAMRQEAHELGVVFDQEAADKAAGFNDSLTRLQGAFTGLANELASALLPVFETLIPLLVKIVKALPIKEIAKLVSTLLPPLVELFLELYNAIPLDMMIKLVKTALGPIMKILTAVMGLAAPLLRLFEPLLMILVAILDALQPVIDALVWIIDIVAGGLGKAVSFISGAVSSLFGGNKGQSVEPMQAGGIVTRPTMALIGEAGPEAVIPLRAGGLGDVINVTVQGNIWAMDDLTDQLRVEFLRIKTDNTTTGF